MCVILNATQDLIEINSGNSTLPGFWEATNYVQKCKKMIIRKV